MRARGTDLFEVEVEHVAVNSVEVWALADGVGGLPVRACFHPARRRAWDTMMTNRMGRNKRRGRENERGWGILDVRVVVAVVIVFVEILFFRPGRVSQGLKTIRTSLEYAMNLQN